MSAPTLQDWIDRLTVLGCSPKATASGWQSRCPAHEDREPSLSLAEGTRRPVVAKCHAGCTYADIRAAMKWDDYRPPPSPQRSTVAKPKPPPEPQRLPSGPGVTATPYRNADGIPVMAVIRKTVNGKKRMSQWVPAGGGLWLPTAMPAPRPLLGLPDVLRADRVLVVEGEKCAAAVRKAWPDRCVTTWAGGSQAWNRTDWSPLAGRKVVLLADADDTGRKAMTAIAAKLEEVGAIEIMLALPEGDDGQDVADWLEHESPKVVADRIRALLPRDAPDADRIEANEHYRLLGFTGDDVAVGLSSGRILLRSRESVCSPNTLTAIAPLLFWQELTGFALTAGSARNVGDSILRAVDRRGAIDMSAIYGRGAARLPDGEVAFHLGDRVRRNGQDFPLDNDTDQIWLAEPAIRLHAPGIPKDRKALRDAVMAYRWANESDGQRFLGWLVSAVVGGALEWRPHLLMIAPAGAGKSWLLRHVVENLFGSAMMRIADGTVAAVARATQASSLPLVVDEAEASGRWVLDLLQLLRVASGAEGHRIRSDLGGGGVVYQRPRFSALLSATTAPRMGAADETRLATCQLGREVRDWPKVAKRIDTAGKRAPGILAAMIRDTAEIAEEAQKAANEALMRNGTSSRDALMTGALTAGWRWWSGGKNGDLVAVESHRTDAQDAQDALMELLSLRVRTTGGGDESALRCLCRDREAEHVEDLLGMRGDTDGSLLIAPTHQGLRGSLRRTGLENVNLRRLLGQIEGTKETNPRRIGSRRLRCVRVPWKVLDSMGINLPRAVIPDPGEDEDVGF